MLREQRTSNDHPFRRQLDQKPSVIPGWPAARHAYVWYSGHSETALALSASLTQDSAQSSELRLSY